MATHQSLGDLPIEIIRRIAGFTTADAVLRLSTLNRRLHGALHDDLVFQAVIRNGNGTLDPDAPVWDIDRFMHLIPRDEWSRVAVADSCARLWAFPHHKSSSSRSLPERAPRASLKWAPQLTTLSHPAMLEVDLLQLSKEIPSQLGSPFDFCLLAAILHQGRIVANGPNDNDDEQEAAIEHLATRIVALMRTGRVTAFGCLLCAVLVEKTKVREGPFLPVPAFSPLLDWATRPFSSAKMDYFTCNCDEQSRDFPLVDLDAFLKDGTWVGYYSESRQPNLRTPFDSPMTDIRFEAPPENELELQGSGTDSVGPFTLTEIWRSPTAGMIVFIKDYFTLGFWWRWSVYITPIGLVGDWGDGEGPTGLVWIWKEDWAGPRPAALEEEEKSSEALP